MGVESWKFFIQQTGILGTCVSVFLYGFHRRWWISGAEAAEKDKRFESADALAKEFLELAKEAIAENRVLRNRNDK